MPRPFSSSDEQWMAHALALARRGEALASPNPMVGAVLVRNQRVVGEGFHTYDALKHAEIIALEAAGSAARRATLYVNLEPCCTTGRTGPCTQALIQGGVARVVAAMPDPNPAISGRGFKKMRAAGIEVEAGKLLRGGAAPKRSVRDVDHYATAPGDAQIRDDARRQSGSAGRGRADLPTDAGRNGLPPAPRGPRCSACAMPPTRCSPESARFWPTIPCLPIEPGCRGGGLCCVWCWIRGCASAFARGWCARPSKTCWSLLVPRKRGAGRRRCGTRASRWSRSASVPGRRGPHGRICARCCRNSAAATS